MSWERRRTEGNPRCLTVTPGLFRYPGPRSLQPGLRLSHLSGDGVARPVEQQHQVAGLYRLPVDQPQPQPLDPAKLGPKVGELLHGVRRAGHGGDYATVARRARIGAAAIRSSPMRGCDRRQPGGRRVAIGKLVRPLKAVKLPGRFEAAADLGDRADEPAGLVDVLQQLTGGANAGKLEAGVGHGVHPATAASEAIRRRRSETADASPQHQRRRAALRPRSGAWPVPSVRAAFRLVALPAPRSHKRAASRASHGLGTQLCRKGRTIMDRSSWACQGACKKDRAMKH
jgi:hypothetical protein